MDKKKIEKTKEILERASREARNLTISWSGGKDSTLLLFMAREMDLTFDVIVTDTTFLFSRTYDFLERVGKELDVEYDLVRNQEAIDKDINPYDYSREECCGAHKTENLLSAIEERNIDYLVVGIRRDEHPARADETYFSEREDPDHTRVHPILEWSEKEVWEYTREHSIPYNPLYDEGYRSIGCIYCTQPVMDDELPEREGRDRDKEIILKRLRELGYY